jgi:hypothetical protein
MGSYVLFNMTFAPHHQTSYVQFSVQSNCLLSNIGSHPKLGVNVKLDHFFHIIKHLKYPSCALPPPLT